MVYEFSKFGQEELEPIAAEVFQCLDQILDWTMKEAGYNQIKDFNKEKIVVMFDQMKEDVLELPNRTWRLSKDASIDLSVEGMKAMVNIALSCNSAFSFAMNKFRHLFDPTSESDMESYNLLENLWFLAQSDFEGTQHQLIDCLVHLTDSHPEVL